MDFQQQKLAELRKDVLKLTDLISQRAKELTQLRREKKDKEALVEALDEELGTHSFNESQVFPWTKEVNQRLAHTFGIRSFRGLQETVINCTLSGKDCIYVAATGSGKSLVFQLPALISSGITLVVSPLLSLMEDQATQLDQLGITSVVLNSTTSTEDAKLASRSMVDPNATLKLIYVTPEKLAKSKYFMSQIEKMYAAGRFSRLVIDEVHCCSEWGHDFRKDYNALHIFKRQYPETPILGLTATATPQVIMDIKKMLGIPKCLVYKGSFYRPNLSYEIRKTSQKNNVPDIVDLIQSRFRDQSGIIYCLSIKDTEDVASKLCSLGVHCEAYHAQLDTKERSRIQKRWYTNQCNVIAATVAFGLGINKMDVRFVIHYSISKSLENYYQETGRAGRDGKPATCVCYYRFADVFRATSLTFRERNGKERVYQMLSFCLNRQSCRKKLIAEYFEDQLQKDKDDTNCCDNCRYTVSVRDRSMIDASEWLRDMIEILERAEEKNQKMTSRKLIDAWIQEGPKKMRLDGINKPILNRADCETVVGTFLCDGYLKESFHMTPYNTISYIVVGSRAMFRRDRDEAGPMIPSTNLEGIGRNHESRDPELSRETQQTPSKSSPIKKSSAIRPDHPMYQLAETIQTNEGIKQETSTQPKSEVEYIDLNIFDEDSDVKEVKRTWDEVECFTID